MEHVRFLPELRLQPEEQKLLLRLEQKAVASATTRGPAHFMVSGHGVCDEESAEALDEAGRRDIEATRALAEHLASIVSPGLDVISVRLLISPPGAPEQPWHLDYARQFREVHTLFVPLTPSTEETCTELLELQKPSADIAEIARAAHGPLPVEAMLRRSNISRVPSPERKHRRIHEDNVQCGHGLPARVSEFRGCGLPALFASRAALSAGGGGRAGGARRLTRGL
eukprot:TRINITY_DN23946_c0_g1_i1.p1 TRINITY_DN23946_c0_g1~~TRINITY_DN23946_c0_g1_i1.p1  ORF type:complete len:226 (-),score=35.98 TRINITY_DN23946_c0_g1_i1:115-792(-)